MTDAFDEYGELLRRALRAEADSVMPSPDGLERIRERIADPRRRAPFGGVGRPWRPDWTWFTRSWVRPMLAAGVAGVVAVAAVSAPPAIHGITSAGDRGPAARDKPRQGGSEGGTLGGRQNPPYPGGQSAPHPSVSVTPIPSPVIGTPTCAVATPAAKPRTSSPQTTPQPTPARRVSALPTCPNPPGTTTPTPAPSTPQVSQPATPSAPPETEPAAQQPAP
jgi:hypothetical protein